MMHPYRINGLRAFLINSYCEKPGIKLPLLTDSVTRRCAFCQLILRWGLIPGALAAFRARWAKTIGGEAE